MSLDVAHIVADLKKSREGVQSGDAAQRAWSSTMNLMVFTSSRENKQWIIERACRLAQKHPSRLMIFDATLAADALRVEASLDGSVSCERIELGVDGVPAAVLGSLGESLIVHDVPIVLWWTDKGFDDERFAALTTVADNVVVDSSGIDTSERGIKNLALAMKASRHTSFRDIAWQRLAPWREQIASFFDSDTLRLELARLKTIEITCGSAAEPLYLTGWFASRLGWQVVDRSTFRDRDGRDVSVTHARKGDPRRIGLIKITTANNIFEIRAGQTWDTIHISIVGHDGYHERPAPILSLDNTTLFEHSILARESDEIFETALRTVGRMLA